VPAANTTSLVDARIGSNPVTPASSRTTPATAIAAAARTSGGMPVDSSADSMKYVAAPTIAPSAQSRPTGSRPAPETRSRTSTSPLAAIPAPRTVSLLGRSPRRSHSHPMTTTGAVYSIIKATPTVRWVTA
jgi:hypothetical protein